MNKALFFNPYLDSLGGGERYFLQVLKFFLDKGWQVDLAWNSKNIIKKSLIRLDIDINRVNIVNEIYKIFKSKNNILNKYKKTCKYNLIFYLSDGSLPFLFGKKNIVHFQVPFKNVNGSLFSNQIKIKFISKIICNSYFTKKIIDNEFKVNSKVLYPPLSNKFTKGKKENLILSVGRFDSILNNKKQDLMVLTFKKMLKKKLISNWKLVLAGGSLKKNNFINLLKREVKNQPIEILENISFQKLKSLYSKAKIYWHEAGYGEDLIRYPERAEHFGLSVVEAMASGAVPIVFNGGGLPEIINNKLNGFLFNNLDELKDLTINLIKHEKTRQKIARFAELRSRDFSIFKFNKRLNEIIQ